MNNLKLDKKTWKDIDIYYIEYVDKNKSENWCVDSVNPLYLMINRVICFVGEKIVVKYLKLIKEKITRRFNINNMESSFFWY